MSVKLKKAAHIEKMRQSGKILSEVHRVLKDALKVGVSAGQLDRLARETIELHGAKPSFLGYRGFKYSTCISKNEEVVHGIPYDEKVFFPGDICSIDCGVFFDGFHTDAARTHIVESADPIVEKLVRVTEESFFEGIKLAKEGMKLGDISHGIQRYVEANGLTVVRDLYSHGIGRSLHEDPLIPNFGKSGTGIVLKEGMTFAIEPMVNIGTHEVLTLDDKWTIITADRKWSAHYENTIVIGKDGAEVLTLTSN